MKSWREKKSKLVQWIRGLAQETFFKLFIFFLFFGVFMLIWAFGLFYNSFHIDNNSARYLLSALVQSQAAIVAIVVTLTLIAMQLVASSYSLRTIDIFKKSPLWWFLTCYGMSIFFGLFVLGLIPKDMLPSELIISFSIPLEYFIYFAYWVGLFTFALLILYMGMIFNFLKPSTIIGILLDNITKESVVNFIESEEKQREGQTQPMKDDPVQPIIDVIRSSIMKYDIATTIYGIRAMTEKAVDAIYQGKYLNNEDISKHFCNHLRTVGECAVSEGDEGSAIEIIDSLKELGTLTIEMHCDKAAKIAARCIEVIGTFAAIKRLVFVTVAATDSLEAVGTLAAKNRLDDTTLQAIDSLGNVGMHAAESKIKIATQFAAKHLEYIGKSAAENGLKDATKEAVNSLGVIGEYAAENGLKDATKQSAESLGVIGTIAAEKGGEFEDVTVQAVESLKVVGKTAARNELEKAVERALESLGQVGKTAAKSGLRRVAEDAVGNLVFFGRFEIEKGNEGKTKQLIRFLQEIGMIAAEKGKELEPVISQVALSLIDVGISAADAEKGLEDAISHVASSLIDVGISSAAKNELDDATEQAAWSLAKLTISSEEIVKTEIQKFERFIKQEYRESFYKFKKLYEHELKKQQQLKELQARKPDSNTTTKP